jgi:uncharacterized protein with HEPN domain
MKHEARKYLFDILEAIDDIREFTRGIKLFSDFDKSKIVRTAVERKLAIIGEAIVKLKKADSKIIIVNAEKIINLRNRLVHSYDEIDHEIIWGIVKRNLNGLRKEVANRLIEINKERK